MSEITVTGEITKIERGMIYIDDSPIKVENPTDYKVGQRVTATLLDKTNEDDWDPDDFKVKDIEIIE